MAPRIALVALSIAFGVAFVGATVRQLNLQAWHSADGQHHAATGDQSSEVRK